MSDRDRRSRDDDDDDRPRRGGRDRDDDRDERGGSARGWRYKERTADDAKHRAERNTSGNDPFLKDAVRVFKPRQGDNTVRFLPPAWEDARHYGIDVFVHFQIGPDRASYLCLDKMKGKACPICEARKRAVSEGDQEFADELRPQSRVLAYVIDRDKPREGALVWGMSARQDSEIARLAIDKATGEALNVDSPKDGYDLTFTREGEGLKTRYSGFAFARRSSELDHEKALEFAIENPLPDALVFYSYDHIAKAFSGTKARSDKDDDDDKPARRGGRDDDKPARRSRDDDDDKPARRPSRDEDDRPARRAAKPEVDLTWEEVHELSFRKLTNLIEEHGLKVDPEASRNDEDLADQICEALDIEKRAKRSSRDDDDAPARRPTKDDDEPPTRRRLREARGD